MKKNYIGLLMLCSASFGHAQVTLQSTDINPFVGEVYDYERTDWMSPGAAGANLTWDFSSIVSTFTGATVYSAADPTFPVSNITETNSEGAIMYLELTATGQYIHGLEDAQGVQTFSDPMMYLTFPLAMAAFTTDDFAATFVSGGFDVFRTGTTTCEVDGWGTVITPNGTYSDVLRVKYNQVFVDSFSFGTIINYDVEMYSWMKAGIHQPLVSFTSFVTDIGSGSIGSYITGNVSVNEINDIAFSVFPNPFFDEFKIITSENNVKSVRITDITGKIVSDIESQIALKETVNISELTDGVYFVSLILNDGTQSEPKRLVKN